MKLRWLKRLAWVGGVALSVSALSPAGAVNINTSASTQCHVAFGNDDTIGYGGGVFTLGDVPIATLVACSVPRSILPAGSTIGAFYFDGDNLPGATTTCSLLALDSAGTVAAVQSFQTSAVQYDVYVSIPAILLSPFGHTVLQCLLPAHGLGALRGMTSLQ